MRTTGPRRAALLLWAVPALANVFVLPGGGDSGIQVVGGSPAAALGRFAAPAGAFQVLAHPSGAKYYVLSRSTSDAVLVVDGFFGEVVRRMAMPQAPAAAALTPDGARLLVLADSLRIFDTLTDEPVATVDLGGAYVDVAVTHDSSLAFAIGSGPGQFAVVDLVTNAVLSRLGAMPGGGSAVTVSPHGRVFVSTLNRLFELDDRGSGIVRTFSFNAQTGKWIFTPDGSRALAVNRTPQTGPALLILNLVNNALGEPLAASALPAGVVLDRLIAAGNTRAFVTSSGAGRGVFQVALDPLAVQAAAFGAGAVDAVASAELPEPRRLFVASPNRLTAVDLVTNQAAESLEIAQGTPLLAYAAPPATGAPAATLLYNNNQVLNPGEASRPLVVRVLDGSGFPVADAPVRFSTALAGVTLQVQTARSNMEGFAETRVTAPDFPGAFAVEATMESGTALVARFNVSVGAGGGSGRLAIVAGDGLMVRDRTSAANALVVRVRDAAGNPMAGASVNWRVSRGLGTVTARSTSDAGGLASATFSAGAVAVDVAFTTLSEVTASTDFASVTFTVVTIRQVLPPGPCGGQEAPLPGLQLLAPTPPTLEGIAGQTLRSAIQLRVTVPRNSPTCNAAGGIPQAGDPIAGTGLSVSTGGNPARDPTASCFPEAVTDSTGVATCHLVLGPLAGQANLTMRVGGREITPPIALRVNAGPASHLRLVQGDNQTGRPSQTLPLALQARVTDAAGNARPGIQVRWEIPVPGTVTLSNLISTAGLGGIVSAIATLGNTAGPVEVRVRGPGTNTLSFTLTANATVGGLTKVSGDNQTAAAGQRFAEPLVVEVRDAQGQPLAGIAVAFRVAQGGATLLANSARSDAGGRASTAVRAGAAGAIRIEAVVGAQIAAFTLTAAAGGVAPAITQAGVLNAASFRAGPIAPGEIIAIFGNNLGPGVLVGLRLSPARRVETSLDGTRVLFDGVPAPLVFVWEGQLSAIVPYSVAGKTSVRVQVERNGVLSNALTIPVAAAALGIFTADSSGRGPGAVLNEDFSLNTPANRARRGTILLIFATGEGQTQPDGVDGQLTGDPLPRPLLPVRAEVGGQPAEVLYAGGAPGLVAGVLQVNVRIGGNVTPGDAVPVVIWAGDFRSQDGVTVAVAP
jgi:uncharacterized protein (TIGR03437 family)